MAYRKLFSAIIFIFISCSPKLPIVSKKGTTSPVSVVAYGNPIPIDSFNKYIKPSIDSILKKH